MTLSTSIFLNFNLPNAATWFYLSAILAVALFFKFTRILSIRNLDVVALFLLVPGLLLRQEALGDRAPPAEGADASAASAEPPPLTDVARRQLWFAYIWLLCGSGYFLFRCFLDLALVRRPALAPNLNLSGLAFLAAALMICLVAVAFRPDTSGEKLGKGAEALDQAQRRVEELASQTTGVDTRFWVARSFAVLCHLAVVAALVVIGWRHFEDPTTGMAAATFYLLLPYTAHHIGQWQHVWPAAMLLWAVTAYRKPTLVGVLLGLAAGISYFPALTFPVWFSFYWKRGARQFTAAFLLTAGLCLAAVGLDLWWSGRLDPRLAAALADWREPTTEGLWTGVHWAYRIPVFIAYLSFLVITLFWPRPKDLGQVIALSAALVIGIQFWYADRGGLYVLWYLPLLLLLVFRPNLADRQAPPLPPEGDWLVRLGRALVRRLRQQLDMPDPVTPV